MWLAEREIEAVYFQRRFYEVDYYSDEYIVQAMVLPCEQPKRIVIYLRGGKGSVGQVRPVRLMQFANEFTFVAAPYYRGSNNNGKDEFGGADLEDVFALVRILRERFGEIPLHIIGFSRGGIQGLLTYQQVNAASFISFAGVSDIYLMYEERSDLRGMMKRLIGNPEIDKDQYDIRNGYQHIKKDSPPVLIIHGTGDTNVGVEHSYILAEKLDALNVPYEIGIYENEAHVFTPPNERKVLKKIQQWMDKVERKEI